MEPAAPRPFRVPALLAILLTVGFVLFALGRILLLAKVTQTVGEEGFEGSGTMLASLWLSEGGVLALSGGLLLGGAWGRVPGWAQVTLAATGVFVAVTAGGSGFPGGIPWYGLLG